MQRYVVTYMWVAYVRTRYMYMYGMRICSGVLLYGTVVKTTVAIHCVLFIVLVEHLYADYVGSDYSCSRSSRIVS